MAVAPQAEGPPHNNSLVKYETHALVGAFIVISSELFELY